MPKGVEELLDVVQEHPEAVVYAGGTDVLVGMAKGSLEADVLVCLEGVGELKGIEDRERDIWIGAGNTHAQILASSLIKHEAEVLWKAVGVIGSVQIRAMGTIGGNLATASPAGDTLGPLVVLGARVELAGRDGRRWLGVEEFLLGPGKTALRPGEIIVGVQIPKRGDWQVHYYEKVGRRRAVAIGVVNMAAMVRLERGVVAEARVAFGAVGPTVMRLREVEEFLQGRRLERGVLAEAGQLAARLVRPIDDIRASASYRRAVVSRLMLRLERQCEG